MAPVLEPGLELPCPLCTAPVMVIPAVTGVPWAEWTGALVLSHHDVPAPAPAGDDRGVKVEGARVDIRVWHDLAATCPMSGQLVKARR